MKAAFILRPNLYTVPGGDTVQAERTAEALRLMGVQVDIYLSGNPIPYADYDLLHLFNVIDCEDLLGPAMNSGKPYVLSTIYVDYREYDRQHRSDLVGRLSRIAGYNQVEYLKTIGKFVLKGEPVSSYRYFLKGHGGSVRYILQHSACLLPNSENEYRRLVSDYGIARPYQVVPNGIDPQLFVPIPGIERDIVLCVGRIEGRKNQLNLVRAMNGTGIPTVFIGATSPNQAEYAAQCKQEANNNIIFIDQIAQPELLQYYARAKVHVLPSWFETTGLSSLEAGAMGCNIVAGDRGDVRDYFGDMAGYCDPGDVNSIRNAVLNAYNRNSNNTLREHILEHFTWQKAADATFKAYQDVIEKHTKNS